MGEEDRKGAPRSGAQAWPHFQSGNLLKAAREGVGRWMPRGMSWRSGQGKCSWRVESPCTTHSQDVDWPLSNPAGLSAGVRRAAL